MAKNGVRVTTKGKEHRNIRGDLRLWIKPFHVYSPDTLQTKYSKQEGKKKKKEDDVLKIVSRTFRHEMVSM